MDGMRFIYLQKEIQDTWVNGWCKSHQDQLEGISNHLGLETEPGQPYLCPCLAAPTEDNLQVSLGGGELAEQA